MPAVESGLESAYITRLYGERQQFNLLGKDEGKTGSYEIAVIQSLLWPGFFTVVNLYKQRWSFLYLGLGLKANQKFIPEKPRDFNKEPNDFTEVKEVDQCLRNSLTTSRRWTLLTTRTGLRRTATLRTERTQTATTKRFR